MRAGRASAAVLALVATAVLPVAAAPALAAGPQQQQQLSAPMPQPAIIAQGVSSANPAHLVRGRGWDFREMRHVFNTVSLLPGDPTAVTEARAAGLAVILEFDFKSYFFAGEDISPKVEEVARQVLDAPGTVVAVSIADRINEKYSPEEGLRYLAATAGVLHREIPGVPMIVNVADWELSCNRPNQSACAAHDPRFQYETDAVLDRLYRSGYVDGFTIADNLKNDDLQAQRAAWVDARTRWPAPFILWSTCSQLSFPDARYPGTKNTAARLTQAYMAAPMAGGADGLALWAWHQEYSGDVYSFLDKNGDDNPLWTAMVSTARAIREGPAPEAVVGAVHASHPPTAVPIGGGPRNSPFRIGYHSAAGFLVILSVLGLGIAARLRQRHRHRHAPPPADPSYENDVDGLRQLRGYGARPRT